jgi:uncharacterized double-CXXCG motif protein
MTRFYELDHDESSHWKGWFTAAHKWGLPGVHCPQCDATWAGSGFAYPAVDLTEHPERQKFETARLEEDFAEFERLRSLLRSWVPSGALLEPGTTFGPLVGKVSGQLAPLVLQKSGFDMLARRDVLEALQGEGLGGLQGCPTELRFRQKSPPELLELQIAPRGLLHPDCLPPGRPPSCKKCGRDGFSLPSEPILDAASLPKRLDLFRLANFPTVLIGTERFKEAVERHAPHCLSFRELPSR